VGTEVVDQKRGKGRQVDPVSASALAANVLSILTTLASPAGNALKRWLLTRKVRKAIEKVTKGFVAAFPEAEDAVFSSAAAIAEELARLRAGKPVEARALSGAWVSEGYFDEATAHQLADDYVGRLNAALLAIDGFQQLMVAYSTLAATAILGEMNERERRKVESEINRGFLRAAYLYFRSGREMLYDDRFSADGSKYEAEALLAEIALIPDWRIKDRFRQLRDAFRDLVQSRYETFVEAHEAGADIAELSALLEELRLGTQELIELVKANSGD